MSVTNSKLAPSFQKTDSFDYFVPPPSPRESVPVSARVDAAMKSRITHVVASQKTPFQNENAYIRAAIHWFTDEVISPRMDKGFQDDVRIASVFVRQAQQVARTHNTLEFCRNVRKNIEQLIQNEATEQAVDVFRGAERAAEEFNEPTRTQALTYLRTNPELAAVRRRAEEWREIQ